MHVCKQAHVTSTLTLHMLCHSTQLELVRPQVWLANKQPSTCADFASKLEPWQEYAITTVYYYCSLPYLHHTALQPDRAAPSPTSGQLQTKLARHMARPEMLIHQLAM
jgi:hypothetical protein